LVLVPNVRIFFIAMADAEEKPSGLQVASAQATLIVGIIRPT